MEYSQILTERRDRVLLITLDRPDRLNAWTPQMMAELTHAIEAADADADIGAVVITGAGRGFCAGADIEATFGAQLAGDQQAARPVKQRDWVDLVRTHLNAAEADQFAVQESERQYLELAYASPEHAEAVRQFLEQRTS